MPDSNSNSNADSDPDSDSDPDTPADAGHGDVDTVDLTAVLDRFEGDLAVLVLEAGGETVGEKVVDRAALPEDARHADAVLELTLAVGDIVAVAYDADETEERGEAAQSRFDRLSRRPPGADDDGNE